MDAGALRWGDGPGRDGDDAIVRELALGRRDDRVGSAIEDWGGRARKLGIYFIVLHFIFLLLSLERFSLHLITYLLPIRTNLYEKQIPFLIYAN